MHTCAHIIYIYETEELKDDRDCGQKNLPKMIWSILALIANKTAQYYINLHLKSFEFFQKLN